MRPLVVAIALALVVPTAFSLAPALPREAALEPRLAVALEDASPADAIGIVATFDTDADVERALAEFGDRPGIRIRTVPALAFAATPAEILDLASRDGVAYVQLDAREPVLLPTATIASRARAVWGDLAGGPVRDPSGAVVDGSGVGVAVVDSGVMGTHPDLSPRMAGNFKVVPLRSLANVAQDVLVPLPDTDTTSGHGTHVAGIVSSSGAMTGGRARGAAPGASLYGFGAGEGAHIIVASAAASFDWIAANHASVTPPIRVVTNSWGGMGAYDPNNVVNRLANALVARGVVVLWAAGNGDTFGDGGDGSVDRVSRYGKNPTPGVIAVANYDDAGTGTRDGALAGSSSRGLASDPATWPDVSAPGSNIYSTLDATGSLSWASKGIDIALAPFSMGGNPFGTAINQHGGPVKFRFGGVVSSGAADVDWILFLTPVAAYNAHRDKFWAGHSILPDSAESQRSRFFWPGPDVGILKPASASARVVSPGDAILVGKDAIGGTGDPVRFQVTSPSGTTVTTHVTFGCTENCGTEIDLHALFPGEPVDGTWLVSPGVTPQVDPQTLLDAANPLYVQMSGTSMATPHVAGVAALLLDADPTLTPAEVEDAIQDTAYKFAFGAAYQSDPQNPDATSSFDKGAGLVDARAAVADVLAGA